MKKIRLAVINDNFVKIGPFTKKGTEIFSYTFISNIFKQYRDQINITAFCSGNSNLPVKIESISYQSSTETTNIGEKNNLLFNMALISKAIGMQRKFDLFHFNNGNGEDIIPFAQFIKKPVIITMHGTTFESFKKKFFGIATIPKHIYFVPISDSQKKHLPNLNYVKTIYHGIDQHKFQFNVKGGKNLLWTGRATPEKGLDLVIQVAKKTKKTTRMFPILKEEYFSWLHKEIIKKRDLINQIVRIHIDFDVTRSNLITEYQNSKVFLFPLRWEEPFGLTIIESMACGTPVIAYAKGSIPEIVKDGETGFVVNSSDEDIRGNWIIKKTGIEGLCEAVQRIYALSDMDYLRMRNNCRVHVETHFTLERMIDEYIKLYKDILTKV